MFTRSGILLFKYWFSVTQDEQQLRRFQARETDPLKQWKLSPIDRASLDKWNDYTEAKEAMFFYYRYCRCAVGDRQIGRQEARAPDCMQHFLSHLDYPGKSRSASHGPDPLIVGSSQHVVRFSEHILGKSLHPELKRGKA